MYEGLLKAHKSNDSQEREDTMRANNWSLLSSLLTMFLIEASSSKRWLWKRTIMLITRIIIPQSFEAPSAMLVSVVRLHDTGISGRPFEKIDGRSLPTSIPNEKTVDPESVYP